MFAVPRPRSQRHPRERGQALVIMVGVMLLGIGLLALIIDGGNIVTQQRITQTGSDSTAEAGAVVLATRLAGAATPAAGWDGEVAAKVTQSAAANNMTIQAAYYTDICGIPLQAERRRGAQRQRHREPGRRGPGRQRRPSGRHGHDAGLPEPDRRACRGRPGHRPEERRRVRRAGDRHPDVQRHDSRDGRLRLPAGDLRLDPGLVVRGPAGHDPGQHRHLRRQQRRRAGLLGLAVERGAHRPALQEQPGQRRLARLGSARPAARASSSARSSTRTTRRSPCRRGSTSQRPATRTAAAPCQDVNTGITYSGVEDAIRKYDGERRADPAVRHDLPNPEQPAGSDQHEADDRDGPELRLPEHAGRRQRPEHLVPHALVRVLLAVRPDARRNAPASMGAYIQGNNKADVRHRQRLDLVPRSASSSTSWGRAPSVRAAAPAPAARPSGCSSSSRAGVRAPAAYSSRRRRTGPTRRESPCAVGSSGRRLRGAPTRLDVIAPSPKG